VKLSFNSLYLRLALVLAAALVAGFATMGYLFHRHLEQDRARGIRHGMAEQIRLIEYLLKTYPDAALPQDFGLFIYRGDTPENTAPGLPPPAPPEFSHRIADDLGHPVELRHGTKGDDSLWIRLAVPSPTWLRVGGPHQQGPGFETGPEGRPDHHPDDRQDGRPGTPNGPAQDHAEGGPGEHAEGKPPVPGLLRGPGPGQGGLEPWTGGLLVSFVVVFIGGMALLWRVQVPLRKLEQALDATRPSQTPKRLELHGPDEVVRLADRFNLMTDRLHQYEQDREVMLAGVAHDLRAPVTRLRLQLELENGHRRNEMLCNLDSIEAIVDQFLLFARGGESEAVTEWDMNAFLAEVTAPYEDQNVSYTLEEKQDVIAPIQPSSLRRALCNLIENALEYGGKPVEVSLHHRGDRLELTVRDHGPGIPEENRAKALRPFTRLDDARARQGHCGLGLSIANRIAESHGGSLILDNAPDGGLLARLVLPLTA
jgi:two-component system osmolarity sensor histidine kinase EnvZ